MRILYLMTEPFGIGGVQSDILMLTEDLTSKGHEVHVATTAGILLEELIGKGAHYVDIDFRFRNVRNLLKAARLLRRVVRERGIDLVAPQSVRSSIAAYLALRVVPQGYCARPTKKFTPIVTTIHNIHNPTNFQFAGRILRHCSDFVIFESNYERSRLLASGLKADRSTVIHSGIDLSKFSNRTFSTELAERYGVDPTRHFLYGIVARLSEEKGHSYLVDAFAKVAQCHPNARLMIVGDGPLLESVRQQVASLGLEAQVIFTGMQRDIPSHLAMFDVFVLSSTRESFPLSAREAMAAGRAVIAPRIGGCAEVVDEGVTGLLFEAANVHDLATQMSILSDRKVSTAMGMLGRKRSERLFSRESWVNGDEKVYLEWASGQIVQNTNVA